MAKRQLGRDSRRGGGGGPKEEAPKPKRRLPHAADRRSLQTDTRVIHHVPDHTPEKTSWEILQESGKPTHKRYNQFARKLFDMLGNAFMKL